jgi:tRNA(Ile)-lysidine synthase TilS/MesJ
MDHSIHTKILTKFTKLVHQKQKIYNIFENNDTILVGISGGKDSLLLLEILGELKTKWGYNFNIIPVHIKVTAVGYSVNTDAINQICENYGFELKIFETTVIFDESTKKGPCFVCSWHRRKLLFTLAREMKCNKIALGHHMDDAVQTLLMNMIFHGSISSMPLRLSMFNNSLELIRPLLFIKEKDIIAYQKIRDYPEPIKDCPYGSDTQRNKMKELLDVMEKINPAAQQNIFKSMSKIYPFYLPEGNSGIINGLNVIHPQEE